MEKVMSQDTKKIIALRFDTVAEAEYLESILEANLKITSDHGRPKEADELLKALKGCIEMFKAKSRVVDDAGVDIETGKYVGDALSYQKEPADPKKEYMDKIRGKEENK
jgi:hypothetical protein